MLHTFLVFVAFIFLFKHTFLFLVAVILFKHLFLFLILNHSAQLLLYLSSSFSLFQHTLFVHVDILFVALISFEQIPIRLSHRLVRIRVHKVSGEVVLIFFRLSLVELLILVRFQRNIFYTLYLLYLVFILFTWMIFDWIDWFKHRLFDSLIFKRIFNVNVRIIFTYNWITVKLLLMSWFDLGIKIFYRGCVIFNTVVCCHLSRDSIRVDPHLLKHALCECHCK